MPGIINLLLRGFSLSQKLQQPAEFTMMQNAESGVIPVFMNVLIKLTPTGIIVLCDYKELNMIHVRLKGHDQLQLSLFEETNIKKAKRKRTEWR